MDTPEAAKSTQASSSSDSNPTVTLDRPPLAVTLPMPVEVKERYLEIREVSDGAVITVIEILSPVNKRKGRGRDTHEAKRLDVLGSASHLVEVDLLRENPPLPINSIYESSDYYILVSIASQRPQAQLYPFTIRETFPTFLIPLNLIPLKQIDEAVPIDMQDIFEGVIQRASYDSRIDYTCEVPPPSLSLEDKEWVADLLS